MGRPAPSIKRESELVNHGRCCDRIDVWVGSISDSKDYKRASGRRAVVQQPKTSPKQNRSAMERSSTELHFASFPYSIMAVGEAVKGQDERQKPAPLTAPPTQR